jgi:MFS family permease
MSDNHNTINNSVSILLPTLIMSAKNFLVFSTLFYLPLYFAGLGFSGLQIGFLLSLFAITSLFSSFLVGLLSDRLPARYLCTFSFVLLIICFIPLSMLEHFWIVAVLLFIGGLGNNIADLSMTSFVLKVSDRKEGGKRLGMFNGLKTLAAGLGALSGGLLVAQLSFQKVFFLLGCAFFLPMLLTLLVKKIPAFNYSLGHYRGDLWKKEILFFLMLIFVFTLHWGAEGTSYSLLLKERFLLSQRSIAVYMGSIWILFALFIYGISRIIKESTPLHWIIYPGLILSGTGHILFTYPSLPLSYVFRLVHECGDAAFEMYLIVGMHRYFPLERVGGTSGVVLTVTLAGRLLGSLIFGPMGEHLGYHYPFILSGILTLLCLPLVNNVKR